VGVGIVIKASMWRMTLGARYQKASAVGKVIRATLSHKILIVWCTFLIGGRARLLRDFTSEFIFFIKPHLENFLDEWDIYIKIMSDKLYTQFLKSRFRKMSLWTCIDLWVRSSEKNCLVFCVLVEKVVRVEYNFTRVFPVHPLVGPSYYSQREQ
jgi:hypothetical protein